MKTTKKVTRTTWKSIKTQIKDVRQHQDHTSLVEKAQLFSTLQEFKNELLDETGRLRISAQELSEFAQNAHIERWVFSLLETAVSQLREQKYTAALDNCQLLLTLQPKNHKALTLRGVALAKLERYQAARYAFQAAIDLAPQALVNYVHRAKLYVQLHAYDKAQKDLQFVLLHDKKNQQALEELSKLFNRKRAFSQTISLLNKAEATQHSVKLLHQLAFAYRMTTQWLPAYKAYKRLVQLNKFDAEALFRMAQIHETLQVETKKKDVLFQKSALLGHPEAVRGLVI